MIYTALRAALGGWMYLLYAALVAAFVGWVSYEKHSYDERRREEGAQPFKAAIESQKREAKLLLAAEISKNEIIKQDWINYARNSDDEYAKKIAAIRASVNVAGGMRFTDPGRREARGCPAAAEGSAGAPQKAPSSGQLSREASTFLHNEAIRADEIVAWARSCLAYVNRE